jgi:hypothetical protein
MWCEPSASNSIFASVARVKKPVSKVFRGRFVDMNVCSVPAVAPAIEAATIIVIDTEAEADLVESACETAVTVTVEGCGIAEGAVYRPEFEMVPVLVLPPLFWFTCHVTVWFVLLATDAANCTVAPTATVAEPGDTETATAGVGGGGGDDGVELPPPQPARIHSSPDKTLAGILR